MKATEFFPYFHPTSVAVIDDDSVFVESITFRFGDKWVCEPFINPKHALSYLQQREVQHSTTSRFMCSAGALDEECGYELVGFRGSEIAKIMSEPTRFSEISVILVDYEMPSMTGLELCEQLSDSMVRKVLLTGKASQDVAVSAFNASIIDGYVKKQSDNLGAEIEEQVERLQKEYFAKTTSAVGSMHALGGASYLADPVFTIMMQSLMSRQNVVEYYALSKPCGIYLGHGNGKASFVRVLDEEEHQAQCEIAELNHAPSELLYGLKEGAIIPCFPTPSGFYEHAVRSNWRQYVFPSHFLQGHSPWRYGLVDADEHKLGLLGDVVSYVEFRKRQMH